MINDKAASGVISGMMIFIIAISAIVGFIWITNEFGIHYDSVIGDPVNNTGIMAGNNSSSYMAVKTTSQSITENLPVGIFIALLFAIIVIVMLVWAILKKGGN